MSGLPSTPSPFDLQPAPSVNTGGFWSTWEDALDIFYSPIEVFQRRRDGRFWLTLLILSVGTLAAVFLAVQMNEAIMEVETARAFAAQGLTGDQLQAAKAGAAKFAQFGTYFLPFFMIVGKLISGLVIFAIARTMGGKLGLGQATAIAVLASFPELLSKCVVGAQGLIMDTTTVAHRHSFAFNASRFLPAGTDNWLLKLGSVADPFVIWGTILVGVGVHVIGGLEKEKAAVLAIVYLALVTTVAG